MKLLTNKIVNFIILCISSLTLEIYLIQNHLFTDTMNSVFPLNILIMFLIIVCCAYVLRIISRTFLQIFENQNYDWNVIFSFT